ncbi:mitochondrial PGP phosphatase-domain-containing protein [Catenaria anguillulae PL171]|uniref:Mitochondrial PGP phosphatase-domain-containing protein n=1 Tax=Catenaria anguillulae PL171 TaxID=765915 RepID=A0A1Y2H826_9FUNG|nr:mitochondrial PGP phosphatase-domain-containing protein [Catenaria anguillulae PL171]
MVQSLNFAGIRALWWVIRNPSLARPCESVPDISHVNFDKLKQSGIKCLVFDKDNCLTAPYADQAHPTVSKSFQSCVELFGRDNVAIYSNSAGTPDDKDGVQAKRIESSLGVPVLYHTDKKPAGGESVVQHFSLKSPTQPRQIAFLGDRLLTDVVFANRNGFYSVHTFRVFTEQGDNFFALWIRRFENMWLYGKSRP